MIEIRHKVHPHVIRARVEADTLAGADLSGAYLWAADLRGQTLHGANLSLAGLERADLRWADLEAADLRGARLARADLRFANLKEADLRGADLRGARLWGANLAGALYDRETRGLHPLLLFLEDSKKVPAPAEVPPAAAPEGRGDEASAPE